jgi:glucan phosphoethanolaminetransferase (alkaline phosphatase superfamily)
MDVKIPKLQKVERPKVFSALLCAFWIFLAPISALKETPSFWHVRHPLAHYTRIGILKGFYPVVIVIGVLSILDWFFLSRRQKERLPGMFAIRTLAVIFMLANICIVGRNNLANIMAGRRLHDHSSSLNP